MDQSKLFAINWRDAIKGGIVAVGTPVLIAIERVIDAGKMDFSWKTLVMAGIGGGVTYLLKNFFTKPASTSDSVVAK